MDGSLNCLLHLQWTAASEVRWRAKYPLQSRPTLKRHRSSTSASQSVKTMVAWEPTPWDCSWAVKIPRNPVPDPSSKTVLASTIPDEGMSRFVVFQHFTPTADLYIVKASLPT